MDELIEELDELSRKADIAVDTDPVVLCYAIDNVIGLCKGMLKDSEGKPSFVGAAFAEQIKRELCKALDSVAA